MLALRFRAGKCNLSISNRTPMGGGTVSLHFYDENLTYPCFPPMLSICSAIVDEFLQTQGYPDRTLERENALDTLFR